MRYYICLEDGLKWAQILKFRIFGRNAKFLF